MSRYHRRSRRLAGGVLVATGWLVLAVPGPARAADVYVQVNPSTVEAGFLVGIRASCRDNTYPATVESRAFDTVTVRPQDGLLTAVAQVPEGTAPGGYRVKLDCPDGENASTLLNVVAAGRPSRGPATGFGGSAGPDQGNPLIFGGLAIATFGAALGVMAVRRRDTRPAGPTTAARPRR